MTYHSPLATLVRPDGSSRCPTGRSTGRTASSSSATSTRCSWRP